MYAVYVGILVFLFIVFLGFLSSVILTIMTGLFTGDKEAVKEIASAWYLVVLMSMIPAVGWGIVASIITVILQAIFPQTMSIILERLFNFLRF